ncbi:MAG: molybdenum cofactor biosynthesis protein MoaE [Acidimicrobiales bacterium]|nr:molybdenum cofactor biosynthesis protein MoaE [Acidimicrobiales bacterium]
MTALSLEAPTDPSVNDWIALSDTELPVAAAGEWIVRPNCGATVVFTGTARDHAGHRTGVSLLEYEAYEEQVIPRLRALATAMRERWPDLERIVLIHRIGPVPITQAAVVVATSSPHRSAAFEAARFGIDTLKSTVPIWKKEEWDGGSSWGLEPQHITEIS